MDIEYNTSFEESEWKTGSLIKKLRGSVSSTLPESIPLDQRKIKVAQEKIKDIRSMMSVMPDEDVTFYTNLFSLPGSTSKNDNDF